MTEQSNRLISLDAFRGLTIAFMVLVNMPGSWSHVYAPLDHAEWFGWTPTDLVFPFFLFIVGVSMVFSLAKRKAHDETKSKTYRHFLIRGAVIFGLGLFINFYPAFSFDGLRFTGVLQRIGIAYAITAFIVLNTGLRSQIWITACLLMFYWGLMTLVPVPGHGMGNLVADGNLAAWFDKPIL